MIIMIIKEDNKKDNKEDNKIYWYIIKSLFLELKSNINIISIKINIKSNIKLIYKNGRLLQD